MNKEVKNSSNNQSRISIPRSDGVSHDLNAIIASSGLSDLKHTSKKIVTEEDHGNIAVNRSDGANHCIINVFKGMSDAGGDTLKLMKKPSTTTIDIKHALTMPYIATRAENHLFPASVRIVHMSDTHNFLTVAGQNVFLPKGDILVHSGNFTTYGTKNEYDQFNTWLGSVVSLYQYRVVCIGCRDVKEFGNNWDVMKRMLSNATHVLCHKEEIIAGIRFYGCPWHWGHHKNYKVRVGAPSSTSGRFEDIPEEVQVLVTHGAAAGILDSNLAPGSRELGDAVKRTKPGLHLHGHSKGAHGVVPAFARSPLVVNACLCDAEFKVLYASPIVIKATRIISADLAAATSTGLAPAATTSISGCKGYANWHFALDSLVV